MGVIRRCLFLMLQMAKTRQCSLYSLSDISEYFQSIGICHISGLGSMHLLDLVLERVWSRSMLSKCVWNRCQISMVKIQQHFVVFSGENLAALFLKCIIAHKTLFSPAFDMRIRQWGSSIFITKIWHSFTFGVLWRTGKVLCLCIQHVPMCSC